MSKKRYQRHTWINEDVKNVFTKKSKKKKYEETICHYGNTLAFCDTKSKIKVYGAGSSRGLVINRDSFLIDVGSGMNEREDYTLFGNVEIPQESFDGIAIEWRDMSLPNLSRTTWLSIVSEIRRLNKDVIVACVGGHGRTGTTLAILAGLMLDIDDPISFIRSSYCNKAVETKKQSEYVCKITGKSTEVKIQEFMGFTRYYSDYIHK